MVWLERGYHDVVVHYLEVAGFANLRLSWDGGVPNTVGVASNSLLCRYFKQDSKTAENTVSANLLTCCVHCRPWSRYRPATSSGYGQVRPFLSKLSSTERQRS